MEGGTKRTSETLSEGEARCEALFQSLECGFCDNRVTVPKEFVCGHVFCLECIREAANMQTSSVRCPRCSVHTNIPEEGVEALPTNMFYKDIAREVKLLESDNKISRGSCKFCCDDDKFPATVKCLACQVPMCEECASHHVHNGVTNVVAIHRKQDSILCDILPKRDTACDKHPSESIMFYCIECKQCLCFKCKDEGHGDHAVSDLADTSTPSRTTLADVRGRLQEYLNETKDALNDIERVGKEYSANVSKTRKQIENQVQMLIDRVIKEKERILAELEDHADEIQTRLSEGQREMQEKDSRAKAAYELTDNLLMYGNDVETTKYLGKVEGYWKAIQDEKLNRFGKGFKMNVQFFMNEGLLSTLSKEFGRLKVTQTLSPWTSRKSTFDVMPLDNDAPLDTSAIQMLKMRAAMSNDFSLKRSPIFAKFVDPKWNLESYKTSKSTGQTVTVWLKVDDDQEQMSRASKRLSMRSMSSPTLTAELESFNEMGVSEYKKSFEKLPDGTIMRLAVGKKDTVMLAVYPGLYAASIISQVKLKSLSRKDTDGIYVAVLQRGNYVCGELRKIPIPEGPGFDFDITNRGMIVLKHVLQPELKIYSTDCSEYVTNHALMNETVVKIMESPEGDIVTIYKDSEGNVTCESINDNGDREKRFTFPSDFLSSMKCVFREARFDRLGNVFVHFQTNSSQDMLYKVSVGSFWKEYLAKPEMLHKVDKLAVLPDGRLCIFDKAECVLMTLRCL
ncbi:hypothetical protein ACF0H5_005820 [Mactra antiquata]